VLADVNGDGIFDIVAASNVLNTFLGQADGGFGPAIISGGALTPKFPMDLIDFNGDGKLDVATNNQVAFGVLPIELVDGVCDQLSDGMVFIGAEAAAPVSPAKKPACAPGALYLDSSEVVAWARNGEAGLLLETGFDSAHRWTVTRWPGGPGRSRAQWSRARRASSSA
jgi:hypothetical protein